MCRRVMDLGKPADRYVRWSRNGVWEGVLKALQTQADAQGLIDWDLTALNATYAKAHRSAAGARKTPAEAEKRGECN